MKVSFVSVTAPVHPDLSSAKAEDLIVYTARVSNPSNQTNLETAPRLLAYLIKHKHWSPFEMVDLTLEIETSRATAAQILRHRSFVFQEFSQRYAEVLPEFEWPAARWQSSVNRQGSGHRIDYEHPVSDEWVRAVEAVSSVCAAEYEGLIKAGVAREQARLLLPLGIRTRLYMKGSLRSWIHYFDARCSKDTQQEHREVAEAARTIVAKECPVTAGVLGWTITGAK